MEHIKALFLAVLTVWNLAHVQARRCYTCTDVTDVASCTTIEQCLTADMQCSVRSYLDNSVDKYELGCSAPSTCPAEDETEAADTATYPIMPKWKRCCNTDYCNRLYNTSGHPKPRTDLYCYSCTGISDPALCLQTSLCQPGYVCATAQSIDIGGGESFNMQCLGIQTCELLGHHLPFGKRLTTCKGCCDERDGCNREFCSRSIGITNMTALGSSVEPVSSTTVAPSTTSGYDNSVLDVTPSSATGIVGTVVDFRCEISPLPSLSGMYLSWSFRVSDESPSIIYNQTLENPVVTLTIQDLNESDAGTYTCQVHHPVKTWSASATLIVQNAFPIITVPPQSQDIRNGYPCTLECIVAGNPTPTVHWSFRSLEGSTYIPSGTTISDDDSVFFNQTTTSHVGNWTCMATNRYGSTDASAFIKVI